MNVTNTPNTPNTPITVTPAAAPAAPVMIQNFEIIGDTAKRQITSSDGKQQYTMHIVFKSGTSVADRDKELAKYNNNSNLTGKIADFASEMKLGVPNENKNKTLTKLELGGVDAKGLPQVKKTYQSTKTGQAAPPAKTRSADHYLTQGKVTKYKSASPLFTTLYPQLAKKNVGKGQAEETEKPGQPGAAAPLGGQPPTGPVAPPVDPSQITKTDVNKLNLGRINPFKIDFKETCATEEEKKADHLKQAEEIISYFEDCLKAHPSYNIAITYSANSEQAEEIYKGYEGQKYSIGGGNQAAVFGHVADWIQKNGYQDRIHILPIPTCTKPGGKEVSTQNDVMFAMSNIKNHIDNDWIVLGLQNQKSNTSHPFAVGGGVASDVWKDPQKGYVDRSMAKMLNPEPAKTS